MSQKNSSKGISLIVLSTIMFGSYGVWEKLIGNSMGTFFQGWTRGLVLSCILLPILFYRKELISIEKRDRKWIVIFLLFTSATQAPIFYAFNHMDIGSASLLFFVTMLLTMYIIGFTFLKEKITRIKVISFTLAFFGLFTIFSFSLQKFTLLAASMAALNGLASGGEVAFSKKLTGVYSPLYVSLMSWAIIFLSNGALSLFLGEKQILPSFQIFWFWQLVHVLVSLVGFWSVIAGVQYLEASIGGLIGLLEVIFSVFFGIVIFRESFNMRLFLGALLILSAASLPHVYDLTSSKSSLDKEK